MGAAPLCAAPCTGVLGAAAAAALDGLEEEEGRAEERPADGGYALGGAALASSLPRPKLDVGRPSSPLRDVFVVSTSNTFWKSCDGTASTLRRSFSGRCVWAQQKRRVARVSGRIRRMLPARGEWHTSITASLMAPAEHRVWENQLGKKVARDRKAFEATSENTPGLSPRCPWVCLCQEASGARGVVVGGGDDLVA
jgi:hypothetical protein